MAGYNFSQNIIGLNKTNGDVHELEVEVANLSASVAEIALDISQLSASTLPYDNDVSGLNADDVQGAIDEIITGEDLKLLRYLHRWSPDVTDFNDFRQETIAWVNNSAGTYQNAPFNGGAYHVLTTSHDSSVALQVAFYFNSTVIYMRTKNGTWSAWYHVNLTA